MDKYRHDLESQSSLRSILNLPSNVSNTTLSYKNSSVDHLALSLLRPYSNFILIGTGWVFNTMALVVFLRTRLKKTTFGHYLCALAIADNLVLTGELFISLGSPVVGINVIHKYDVICRLTYCIRYAARLWSAVLVTLITIERYYFIVHPLKMTHLHTTFAAKLIICTSFLASCLMSLYAVFLVHVEYSPTIQRSTCVIRHDCLLVFSICDLVVSRVLADFITGFLILTFTLFIACHLVKVNKTRRSLQVHICPQSPQRELQVTIMLLVVAVTFIALKVPYTITWYWKFYLRNMSSPSRVPHLLMVATQFSTVLSVLPYSINFFLYSLCGSSFREALRSVFSCQGGPQPPSHTSSDNGGRLLRYDSSKITYALTSI